MPHTLYVSKNSGSFAVEAAFVLAKVPFKSVEIDTEKKEQKGAAFTAINPLQQVPALVLEDGTVMSESVAMILHLADLYPASGIAPPAGTAASACFLRWLTFMTVNIYEADLRYFYAERYTDEAGLPGTRAAASAAMQRHFAILEEHALTPGPYVAGDQFTSADAYLAMLTKWSPEPVTSPRVAAVVAAVGAHPLIGPLWREHGFG